MDLVRKILEITPVVTILDTSIDCSLERVEEYSADLHSLIQSWINISRGYTYQTKEGPQDYEDNSPPWYQQSDESLMVRYGTIVMKEEKYFPDPMLYLKQVREKWPATIPVQYQYLAIQSMPLKGCGTNCDLCGMKVPFELTDEIGFNQEHGYVSVIPLSLSSGFSSSGSKWVCKDCSSKFAREQYRVIPILFSDMINEYKEKQEEEQRQWEEMVNVIDVDQ
jgi:hypothetical protein